MTQRLVNLTYEVELKPGEKLVLPESLAEQLGPGRWLITIAPREPARGHGAFLRGYAPEDEGLYDDYPTR